MRFRMAERRLWGSVGLSPSERMVPLRTGETVRVLEVGHGPPVLFVHGASNGASSWVPLVGELEGVRCLLLDRPGCGLSDPVAGGAGLGDLDAIAGYADELVVNVLDALDVATAAVVATSYGGYFAFRGAAAHPERIDRVVEFSWPVGAPIGKVPLALRLSATPGLGALMASVPPTRSSVRMLLRQAGLRRAIDSGRLTDEMLDWFLSLLRDTPSLRNELRASPDVVTPIRGFNDGVELPADLLASATVPVLFIWGAEDPNGGAEVAEAFAKRFANATVEVLTEAGHAPWIDEPATSAALASAFLLG